MMYQNAATVLIRFLTIVTVSIVLVGCGQGSGSQPIAGTERPPLTGVLLDSPVEGVTWQTTAGTSGVTNALGEFQYLPEDTITFSIGDIILGAVKGGSFVTVVQLTNSSNPATPSATNMLVFLQSMDSDGDPTNGIQVSAATIAAAAGQSIDFTAADFATRMATLVRELVGPDAQVVSDSDALDHFYTTYVAMGGTAVLGFNFPGYPAVGAGEFKLVFADEFSSGDSPSTENWSIETGYGPGNSGWGNNEWQLYTTSRDNVRVEDGNLVIQARCEMPPCGSRDGTITSGKINSLNKFNFKYGKVVARIKPPVGTGVWPAFWALGVNHPVVGWPLSGEIDFMEIFNTGSNPRTTHATLHWCEDSRQAPAPCTGDVGRRFEGGQRTFDTSLGDDFHIWEADWDENGISMKVDGLSVYSRNFDPVNMGEFLKQFYMILNVAMGGTLGSDNQPPSGLETFPQTMLVDYVRVFQKVGSGAVSSQTINFEDAPASYVYNDFEGGVAAVIPNPIESAVNTSAQVGEMVKFDGAGLAGSSLELSEPLAYPSGGIFSVKVWSSREVPVLLKLEGATNVEQSATHTGSGWETLAFNFIGFSGAADFITLIFDSARVGDAANDPANWTFYFDDIVFNPSKGGGEPGEKEAPTLTSVSISSDNANSALAKPGDTVTVTLFADEVIRAPSVVIAGASADAVTGQGARWQATRTLGAADTEEGLLEFSVAYTDTVGNAGVRVSGSSDSSAVVFDATAPTLMTSGLAAELTSLDPVTVTFQFSEDVSGFELDDIVVVNGSASAFASIDAATYTAAITPAGEGQLSVSVADAAAHDVAGNTSVAANTIAAGVDTVAPTVVIEGVPAGIVTLDSFTVTFQFSEVVTGFDLADVQVTNGTASGFEVVDGDTYLAVVLPQASGDLAVSVAAGAVADAVGNINQVAVNVVALLDVTFPSVAITGLPADFATLDPIAVTFQFSEPVFFDVTAIAVTNGVASGFMAVDADTYTALVTPDGAGDISVSLVDASVGDGVGNLIIGASVVTALIDAVAPTVVISGVPSDFNTLDLFAVTFQFSELVSGFDVSDIQVTNGTASGFTPVDGDTYTANVTPDGAGNLTVSVAADAATDGVGNPSVAASGVTALIDAVAPTLVISGAPVDFTTLAAINLIFQFSEAVTGFTVADIVVNNGTASAFVAVDNDTYTAKVTPNGSGNLTVSVAAAAAKDRVGNASVAATNVVVTNNLDTEAPLFTLISIASDNANPAYATTGNVVTINMTANEIILEPAVTINGVAADAVTGSGAMWQATRTMLAGDTEGEVAFTLDFEDTDNNVGPQSTVTTNATTVTFDVTAPTVSINGLPATFDVLDPIAATFQFSEDVTGFDASDVTVTNGALSAFVSVNASTYTASITPDGSGNLTVSIAAGAAADVAGVASLMPADKVVTNDLDVLAPELSVVSIASNNSDSAIAGIGDVVTITMTANEAIVAPVVTIGGAPAVVTGSGTAWQAARTLAVSDSEGAIAFSIDFEDLMSNAGTQVTATTDSSAVVFDRTGPTLTVVSIASNNSNAAVAAIGDVITVAMTADEAMVAPVVTIGGAAAAVTGSGTTWQATRTLLATDTEGAVAFTIDFEDVLSNTGTQVIATTDASVVTFDRTAPTVAITGLAATFTSLDQIAITFTFSENVSDFVLADVTVTNGAADALVAVNASTYTTNVTPDGNGDLTVEVGADVAVDSAGNPNTAATATSEPDLPPAWQLVWSDSFDGAVLDLANWTKRTDFNCSTPCEEGQQSYNTNNVSVIGGVLTIRADETAGPAYVSGLIDSRGKRQFKYGRFEIDARMPGTPGAAPSLMMLPASDVYGAWPLSGEIDIANAPDLGVGNAVVEQSLSYGLPVPENTETIGSYDSPTAPDTNFITYAVEWEAGEIRWFVDNVHVLTQSEDNWYTYLEDTNGVYAVGTGAAPFDEDFYLTLSLAVNDNAGGGSMFPQVLEIDAVRVYECANAIDPVAGSGCSTGDISVLPVVAANSPYSEILDLYTDGLATVAFVDEAMATTNSTLVAATVSSDGSVVVNSNTAAVDSAGGTLWNLDITAAATGVGDALIQPGVFVGSDAFINLSGGGTAGELLFRMRVNSVMNTPVLSVGMEDSAGGSGESMITYAAVGVWQQYSVKISDIVTDSVMSGTTLDLANVFSVFKLSATGGSLNLDVDDIQVKVACLNINNCQISPSLTEEAAPPIVDFSQDFEAMTPEGSSDLADDNWLVGANVFAPDGVTFLFNYFSFPAPNGGPAFSSVAILQGGVPQGDNVLAVYNDYNNASAHNAGNRVEANVFRERLIVAGDIGRTFTFSFDAKKGTINNAAECATTPNPPCDSTALAFIKVIDPNNGFVLVVSDEIDTTNLLDTWDRYTVSIEVANSSFIGQLLQFGFINVASNFEPSGVFYDNIEVTSSSTAP